MNKNSVDISVVVISFNGISFIDDCLSSVVASLENVSSEIIVVDNASTDGTIDIIKNKYQNVVLIRNETNLGFARAVNQGLTQSQGEYILILNQDTRIQNNAISKLAERMRKDSNIGSIGPRFVGFDGLLQKCSRAFPRYRDLLWQFTGLSYLFPKSKLFSNWKMGWFDHLTEKEVDQPMGAALMISCEILNRIGQLDESFGIFFNDVDYCRRISKAGYINLYYPEAVIEHYIGGSTKKQNPKMIIESHRAMYKYFKKYSGEGVALPGLWFWGAVLHITAYLRASISAVFKI